MKQSVYKKITSISLSLILTSSVLMAVPVSWASQTNLSPEKHETVYVNLYPDGRRRNVIDSTWIQNSRELKEFKDNTILKQVESVSGAKLIQNNNGDLVWDTNGDDVYYQSPVDKKIPISVDISYYLDGKKMSPEEIAGKSGRAKIRISLKNNDKHGDLYTPFTAVTVVPLKNDVFTDVSVSDGKIFSDGNAKMVICIGFPSLEEMLDLQNENIEPLKDLDFPDEFTIEADVKEFELAAIGIAVSPEIPDAIKDMDEDEDIQQDIDDIQTIIDSKDIIESVDPNNKLKDLVRNNDKVNRSRELIDDLYDFYDLDTSILEELPEYVTHENIELIDKIKDDADKYYADEILDNEVIRHFPEKMDADNIYYANKLLKWHDVFKDFDESRLDQFDIMIGNRAQLEEVMDEAEELIDSAKGHEEEFDTLSVIMAQSLNMKNLIKKMESANISSSITPAEMNVMAQALIKEKVKQYNAKLPAPITSGGENLNTSPALQMKKAMWFGLLDKVINKTQNSNTSGAAIQVRQLKGLQQVVSGGAISATHAAMLNGVLTKTKQQIQNEVTTGVQSKFQSLSSLSSDIANIKGALYRGLGSDYKDDIEYTMSYMGKLKRRMNRLKDLGDKYEYEIEQAKDVLHDKDTLDYLEEWKDKLEDAKDDIDDNDENVEILKELLAEYEKPKIKHFYDHLPELLDDLDELRPIAESFNDMLEKPRNDKIVHDMPETLQTLIRMRRDILNSRDITDTLALGMDQRVIDAAQKVLDIIDAKDKDNKLDEMKDQLESIDNILDKKDRLIELSDEYDTFAGKQSDIKSHVSFILKTDSIELPEESKDKVEQSEDDEEKSGSFLGWVKSLFARLFAFFGSLV